MKRKLIIYITLIIGLSIIFGWIHRIQSKQTTVPVENKVEVFEFQKDELDLWLDELAKKENCPIEGIIDRNHKMSFGKFCFQFDTFKIYVRKYNLLPNTEDQELYNWISDNEFQRKLARMMLEEDINNWKHWQLSTLKIGKPPKVVN